jgi:hypothetical protein
MVDKKREIKKLYDDAQYFHLLHSGKKVIKNKYGLFWR